MRNKKQERFDIGTPLAREELVRDCYLQAKRAKEPFTRQMVQMNQYYNGNMYAGEQIAEFCATQGLSFAPPCLPDPRIQVESQIDPTVPQFAFRGRDNVLDPQKAKIRQDVVDFICYNNRLSEQNIENERNLNKYGNAFWKVSFDGAVKGLGFVGDICIGNPSPAHIYPDPSAYTVDDCEYIIYTYRIHRRRARRTWGCVIDGLKNDHNHGDTEIFAMEEQDMHLSPEFAPFIKDINDDTLQVIEFWYRDDEGDIACSVQIDNKEVQFIPKYWQATRHSGNQLYPFVKYGKTPMDQSFWDEGEIAPVVGLVDAANRELLTAIVNHMMTGNDVVVAEEGAFADDFELDNSPGAVWKLKANKMGRVQRLGGLQQNTGFLNMVEFLHAKIEETNGNYQSRNGLQPDRVTTFRGLQELNARADTRQEVKKAGRQQGFRRLFELIDWSALEFYNTDRLVMIRGNDEGANQASLYFNSEQHRIYDDTTNRYYYPLADVELLTGKGMEKSPQLMLDTIEKLSKTAITPENAPMVKAMVQMLTLPNTQEILDHIDNVTSGNA
ncbi:MAG: hypothetical protein H7Y41_03700 [Hyphomonadaceae bacterium]|nr:hypothetical protein [Clostridia bacterium]